jgi:holo-[acyl-carrier protein] synthase
MILGIGSDIIDIRRIERSLARHGERFIRRLYTPAEQAKARRRANPVPTYAKRFAAKEACSKALGTGMSRGVFFKDMGVVNDAAGKPTMELTGGALARLKALTPPGKETRIHVTITDERDWAQAFVIIEAI